MQAKVLIIEDEIELAELESLYLKKEGIDTEISSSAEKGFILFEKDNFDLIILDINLPGIDGFEFLSKLRKISDIPVIIVSAREADEDIIMGLGIGADEFVVKPFIPKVLVARVRAIIRRVKQHQTDINLNNGVKLINFDDFEMNEDSFTIKRNGKIIPMPIKEFEVLCFLVKNAGKIFSTQQLYDEIWEQEFGDISAVTVYVQRIRKKIESDYHNPKYIKTIRSKGYLFEKDVIKEWK